MIQILLGPYTLFFDPDIALVLIDTSGCDMFEVESGNFLWQQKKFTQQPFFTRLTFLCHTKRCAEKVLLNVISTLSPKIGDYSNTGWSSKPKRERRNDPFARLRIVLETNFGALFLTMGPGVDFINCSAPNADLLRPTPNFWEAFL